jgi:integrase
MSVHAYRLAKGQLRWLYMLDLPVGPDGRRRQQKRKGFLDEAAARKAEDKARCEYGRVELAADGTVAAELTRWLDERELDLESTSLDNYRDVLRCYVFPHLGNRQLYTVDKQAIHGLYKTLLRNGGKRSAGLSPTTVRLVHRVLTKALRDLGFHIDGVRQPRPVQREIMGRKGIWTPAEATQFLHHHLGHRLRAAWVMAVVVGTRRGELAGLKWSKVDLDRAVLFIHWQRTAPSGVVLEKAPKGKSRRAVAIGPAMVAELQAHRERQRLEQEAAGALYHDGDYVFCREDGKPYYPKYLTDHWAKACADAAVPVIALHDARHTSATTGADAGVPEHVMQRRLGHADARTTRDWYTHVLPESERRAAELMETVLGADPNNALSRRNATSTPRRRAT